MSPRAGGSKPAAPSRVAVPAWSPCSPSACSLVLAFTGDYVAPYGTPVGQVVLVFLLAAYAGGLLWMRKMADGKALPRFLGPQARADAR